ncbi:MAG: efflux RND transporter periplasmic adaptor subunit [Candidatus Cloacimonetes bacterium]|nr:efflux RND transporter periplasmic adaptor subunit [Candidatus Cloacimonadota bacterium]
MKKNIILIIMLALLVWGCGKAEEEKQIEIKKQASREVKAEKAVQKELFSHLEYCGRLEAESVVNISPAMSSKIEELKVSEGSHVKKGQLLAILDDSQLAQTETQFANLKKNYQRMINLRETGSIDERSFEEVETAYLTMKESLDFMRENTRITAPVNGVISKLTVKEGEMFNSMMNPFFLRMLNLEKMLVKVNLSDMDMLQVAVGQRVQVSVDKFETIYEGKVAYISPEADLRSGTFECGIKLDNINQELKHNQFARVRIVLENSKNAIVIPGKAVLENSTVYVVKDGKAELRKVKLGIKSEKEQEILSGVDLGEMVIVIGVVGLRNGDPVSVIK